MCSRLDTFSSSFSPTFEDCSLSARDAPRLGRQAQNQGLDRHWRSERACTSSASTIQLCRCDCLMCWSGVDYSMGRSCGQLMD